MEKKGLLVKGSELTENGTPLLLRGVGIGNYMNIEHFMFGLPGSEAQIRRVIERVYGEQNSTLFWNRFHNAFLSEGDFAFFRDLGLNSARLALNYRHFESDDEPGRYRPEGFALLDRALELAERYGLYLILDMHAAPGGQNPDWHCDNNTGLALFWEHRDCRDRIVSLWKAIARRYRDNPWLAGYDIINEPVPADRERAGRLVDGFYHQAAAEIRSVDRNHILFLEGDFYGQDTRGFTPLKDPAVVYSIHYYPFFSSESVNEAISDPDRARRVKNLQSRLEQTVSLGDIRGRLGRPVWCGETGVPSGTPIPDAMNRLLADTLGIFEKETISWSLWNGKDARAMGLIRPREDSPWMELCRRIKPVWDIGGEMGQARKEAEERAAREEPDPGRREELIRDLQFRLLAIRQREETARLERILKTLPFPELLRAVESFRFDNCEIWSETAEVVKGVTGR